ncbi:MULTISPECIES: UDP-N-acetylmuramate dehydrogenase [unclassified Hydrogenobaculum]|uniref:UDP-N-acetylmuramate dehydrogenase n=1 Tax=unclassified Hydrogenobaculum TaxID=2622382 RepID=UPI0001C506C5|nr:MULTISPECIES: UDP-N-acetylmuramate dehydrogenase [unclassified Hydrogenobaculum]AEF18551.1 UDP-N-acetylenolpyruvoylglucosamine reductase [Hydrogenobaculum sp. 3684]AEG45839.1 UDP-N-acetylenolpyruvoylglucosamine reductase [Hydrogenobaculum sp. SHO]AGG14481.1 UDP-N-acetylmuramate dehydrogenase [Hydrogenobaculum sp. HO]AGH92785.1 UDP-N-acetylmuramate dehydrogenase [Hydrogenobaculum sp. SN]
MIINKNADLKDFTTIKIGGVGSYMFFPENEKEFLDIYKKYKNDKLCILGKGSNTIFGDFNGVLINTKYFYDVKIQETKEGILVKASAGVPLKDLIKLSIENNVEEFYKLIGFPASIGGAIAMNAGAYGVEIFDFIKGVWFIDEEEIIYKPKEEIFYTYRKTEFENKPVLYGEFLFRKSHQDIKPLAQTINQKRIEAQPLNMPTSGSTFKNPKGNFAGKLLEAVGLKGYRIKDIGFSQKHANFLINYQNASFQNVIDILSIAKEQVYKAFNIILEEEIKLICA